MTNEPPTPHAGWEPLPHGHVPRPNFFPAGLAMGTTLIFWGFITSVIIFLAGTAIFIAALTGWITEIRHERRQQEHNDDHQSGAAG